MPPFKMTNLRIMMKLQVNAELLSFYNHNAKHNHNCFYKHIV